MFVFATMSLTDNQLVPNNTSLITVQWLSSLSTGAEVLDTSSTYFFAYIWFSD